MRRMARPGGLELPTFWFVARRSIQLSYGRAVDKYYHRLALGIQPPRGASFSVQITSSLKETIAPLFRIGLLEIVSRIQDGECPVRFCGHFEVLTLAFFFHIGDEHLLDIVRFVRIHGVMQLPQVLKSGRIANRFPGIRASALVRPVIHDGNAWMQRVDDDFCVGLVPTVMGGQKQIDGPDQIVRAHQVSFLLFGEITEIDEAELPKSDLDTNGTGVLGCIGSRFGLRGTKRIRLPRSLQRRADVLACRGQNLHG